MNANKFTSYRTTLNEYCVEVSFYRKMRFVIISALRVT